MGIATKKIKTELPFEKLIGTWKTSGRILKTAKSAELKIKGTDTYALILGGKFMLHTARVMMGAEKSETYEIIGPLKSQEKVRMQYFDSEGKSGMMWGALKGNDYVIKGKALRFKGTFKADGKELKGVWERLVSGKWRAFLEIKLNAM